MTRHAGPILVNHHAGPTLVNRHAGPTLVNRHLGPTLVTRHAVASGLTPPFPAQVSPRRGSITRRRIRFTPFRGCLVTGALSASGRTPGGRRRSPRIRKGLVGG